MAEEEPLLANPTTHDVAVHVADYDRFITMSKWGAVTAFIIAIIVLVFIL
jgi:hypothetical protein